jgi:hypothetical protein
MTIRVDPDLVRFLPFREVLQQVNAHSLLNVDNSPTAADLLLEKIIEVSI